MRYNVFAGEQLVACLRFGASAWKLKDRARFIGWSETQRSHNLHLVVNNARFLILPWVRSLGLASKILSMVARLLPEDWMARYGFAPVLPETFVEFECHKGTCYKAANWLLVERTAGPERARDMSGGRVILRRFIAPCTSRAFPSHTLRK